MKYNIIETLYEYGYEHSPKVIETVNSLQKAIKREFELNWEIDSLADNYEPKPDIYTYYHYEEVK